MRIINISDPANPFEAGHYNEIGYAYSVFSHNGAVYLGVNNAGLFVFGFDLAAPIRIISGYVRDAGGPGLSGVQLNLYGSASLRVATTATGYYAFGVPDAGDYTVTPLKNGYTFSPQNYVYASLSESRDNQNFTGAVAGGGVNTGGISVGDCRVHGGADGYVNPVKGETVTIRYMPAAPGEVTVGIYTMQGALVWETAKSAAANIEDYIDWNCYNKDNSMVASGIYLVRVKGCGIDKVKKAAIIK